MSSRAASSLAVAAVVLAACRSAPADDALFPLAEGRQWTYRVSTTIDEVTGTERATLVLANRGEDRIDGAVSWRRRSDSGIEYWLRTDPTGIYRIASRSPLDREPLPDKPRRYVLKKPYAVGTEWESPTTAYVLSRKNETPHELRHVYKDLPMHYRIESLGEKVRTAAGDFDGCVRVAGKASIRLYDDAMRQFRDSPLTTTEWYCPNVGLVRLERQEPSPTRLVAGGVVTMELTSWH